MKSATSETDELDWASVLSSFQTDRRPRVDEIVDSANRRGSMKKDLSDVRYLVKKWMMWVVLLIMRESWGDGLFGYKVPEIDEW